MFTPDFLCNSNHYLTTLEVSWLSVFLAFYLTVNYILNNPAGWMILNYVLMYVIFFPLDLLHLDGLEDEQYTCSVVLFLHGVLLGWPLQKRHSATIWSSLPGHVRSCSSLCSRVCLDLHHAHLSTSPKCSLILMLGMSLYCLIIIYWLYLNARCFSNVLFNVLLSQLYCTFILHCIECLWQIKWNEITLHAISWN